MASNDAVTVVNLNALEKLDMVIPLVDCQATQYDPASLLLIFRHEMIIGDGL